ncbi:hypothetical protein AN641_01345 [Candidatus Epulonipiscioides gigas]|nr:hypothetical protein AN641_01345 [Epulopiscium sp. SCG-C07WGA-EpuloA2]
MIDKIIKQTVYNQQRKRELKQHRSTNDINSQYINYTTKQSKSLEQSLGYLSIRPPQQNPQSKTKNSNGIIIALVIGGILALVLLFGGAGATVEAGAYTMLLA